MTRLQHDKATMFGVTAGIPSLMRNIAVASDTNHGVDRHHCSVLNEIFSTHYHPPWLKDASKPFSMVMNGGAVSAIEKDYVSQL
jgi:hypothetical protein